MATSTDAANVAQWDLTRTLGGYLDKHLVLQLLEFLQPKKIFDEKEILAAKLELLSKTCMVDFAKEVHTQLHGTEVPQAMEARREAIIADLERLQEEAAPLVDIIDDEVKIKELTENKVFNFAHLEQNHKITEAHVKALYHWAKFQFECGNYGPSALYLGYFRDLSNDAELTTAALWGILAAEILTDAWEGAAKTLNQLRELIDSKSFVPPAVQLQQRTWLIHWSLFVFFNHTQGRAGAVEWFLNERYLNTIQTTCPHILRYLTVAIIANKKRRNSLKELVKVIDQEGYEYSDPVTEFVDALFIQFNFENAEQKLRLAEQVLEQDYFLHPLKDEFVENARLFIFENFCKIHNCIDLKMLAEKLSLSSEEAERWIVNLIRNARLDAKIDSQANQVLLGSQVPSPYQMLIDKTKGLALRSVVLSNNIERARNTKQKQKQQTTTSSSAAAEESHSK
jgi:translation initiation factor 3 subunit E